MFTTKTARYDLRICCWLFCVFTVNGLAGMVAWLSLTPKNPNLRISSVNFPDHDSRNHINQSSPYNTSIPVPNSIIFGLQVFNPNKRMGVNYSVVNLELHGAEGDVVGKNSIPGFYQGYKNNMTLQIVINVGREFWRGVNGGGDVDFMVRVETDVKFRIIRWTTKAHQVMYEERFRKVTIDLNGTVSGGDYAEMQNTTKVKIKI